MGILRTRLSRRRLLTIGATGLGASMLAGASAQLAPTATSQLRPAARAGSSAVCALCGDPSHTMLGGPHGLAAPRR